MRRSSGETVSMALRVPPEYEAMLEEAVAKGQFENPEAALRHALELFKRERERIERRRQRRQKAWAAKVRDWANGHTPVGHFVDDRRESIY